MEKNNSNRILIKKKGKYLREIAKASAFLLIAVISGVISSKIALKDSLNDISDYKFNESNCNIDEVFTKGITNASHSLVTISDSKDKLSVNTESMGNTTGIIMDKQGHIVTSLSKIKNMDKIFVKFSSLAKEPVEGMLVGADENTDVALIKVNSGNLTPINISDDDLKEGNFVIAVGNSISNDFIGMTTLGIVTSTNGKIYDETNNNSYKIIQTNAVITDGNIGGPLCNVEGELVGFNSYTLNSKNDNRELYYSLSAIGLKKVVDYIISFTDKLGISGELIDDKESNVRGLYIENIKSDGYAAKAGLLPTDIILSVDDKKIMSLEDIDEIIKTKKSGKSIQCEILRDGTKINIEIMLD